MRHSSFDIFEQFEEFNEKVDLIHKLSNPKISFQGVNMLNIMTKVKMLNFKDILCYRSIYR